MAATKVSPATGTAAMPIISVALGPRTAGLSGGRRLAQALAG
ncbi:hypothetical protein [Streptacidiphilus sp. MAP12-20]